MSESPVPAPPASNDPILRPEEARWLHDKYERLAAEEGQLSGSRTSYYAAIGTVLITGLLVAIVDLMNQPLLLVATITFLAALGIMISLVWAVLLHRTTDAQNMWREAARSLEQNHPPLVPVVPATVTLRSRETMPVDLARPYSSHEKRFADARGVSWMDRVDPATLTELLPQTFIVIWVTILAADWLWYLALR